jgi:hypothetical protein
MCDGNLYLYKGIRRASASFRSSSPMTGEISSLLLPSTMLLASTRRIHVCGGMGDQSMVQQLTLVITVLVTTDLGRDSETSK